MSRVKAYKEEVVLENAMQVFWSHGYEATSVRMLEKEMSINQFSIYSSFTNKKTLFKRSIRQYREYVKQHVFSGLLQEGAGLNALETFFEDFLESLEVTGGSKGCLVINAAAEWGDKDAEIALEINAYYHFIRVMLKNLLTNAVAKHEIPLETDIEKQACFFLGIMQGLSVASKTMNKDQLRDYISVAITQIK
ncbi:MAG: TetR/AcrR family transcriptional regulator [Bacteroidetes bacterium HGW-Bacteroidetes-1]|jgi:TetR/AcrR family transcriptional repressor of nem operon|nr:MAG: TetR/AcrR family transcriptional regulator [Bacteroidetes bacterium HGW-Bacteroidetes-1]